MIQMTAFTIINPTFPTGSHDNTNDDDEGDDDTDDGDDDDDDFDGGGGRDEVYDDDAGMGTGRGSTDFRWKKKMSCPQK